VGIAHARLPFWRVVVECVPNERRSAWPADAESGVTCVFVWARASEEAEGLARLALDEAGLDAITADATRAKATAAPRRRPEAVARTRLTYLRRDADEDQRVRPAARGAPR
jgi:hypothetical protein